MRALVVRASLLALATIIVWQGVGLMVPPKAGAHAVLERSVPEQNQQLQSPPGRVEIWFTEPIDPALTKIQVFDALGTQVDSRETTFSDDPLYAAVELQQDLAPGVYTTVYENLSKADGHAYQGFFPFVILNPDGSVPAVAATPVDVIGGSGGQGSLPDWSDGLLRWASLLAAVTLAGSALFYLLVLKPGSDFLTDQLRDELRKVSRAVLSATSSIAAAMLFLSALGQLALLVDRLGGLSRLGDILFDTRTGELWLARLGLSAALAMLAFLVTRPVGLRFPDVALPSLLALGAAGVLMTYALGSHAAAGGGEFAATASDFVHFLATGVWLGLLAHLGWFWRSVRRHISDPERLLLQANILDRFSVLAGVSVAVLLATGLFNAFVQLPTKEALWETAYGRTLMVKLGLVLPLLAIAGLNAFFLKPALVNAIDAYTGEGDDSETDEEGEEATATEEDTAWLHERIERLRRVLPRTIALELGLGAAVLATVAVLAQTATADGELAQKQAAAEAERVAEAGGHASFAFTANKPAGDLAIELRIDPQVVGINTYEVRVGSAEGRDVGEIQDVALRFFYSNPPFLGSTEDVPAQFEELDPDRGLLVYEVEGAYFGLGGSYRVQVDVRRPGQDDVRAIFPLQVGETPEERPEFFDIPFDLGTGGVVGASALLLASLGLLLWRHQFGILAPWGQRAAEIGGAAALLGGLMFAGGDVLLTQEPSQGNPIALTDESVAAGRVLFERNCMSCHGQGGRGDGPAGLNLFPQPADFLVHVPYHGDETLFGWISDGVAGSAMPSFADQLSEEDRWNLVNYLRKTFGEGDQGFVLPGTEEPGTPEPGQGSTVPSPTTPDGE